jgi:hypothetical protein
MRNRTAVKFALLIAIALLAASPVIAAPGEPDPAIAAIQTVIQRANQEQVEAFASGDPTVMSDTSTSAHYRELLQTNQGLADLGATDIELLVLAWGPIGIMGNTASATTSETWLTTFSDGTTLESTDTNVYSLTLQGGTWLIAADVHPPALAAPTPRPTPQAPAPMVPAGQSTSHNWSGYFANGGHFTSVTGTWTVPQPNVTGGSGIGATWVGIGGVDTTDLIQAGTQDATSGGNQVRFEAWIEMLPQRSQQVPLAVAPGDSVSVALDEQGAGTGTWQITITNNSSGQTFQTTVTYTSSESSAEWIEEAPSGAGGILPLDNFNSVSITRASATQDGATVTLVEARVHAITMLNASNQPLAVPSALGRDGSSFSVTRTSVPAFTPRATQRP